MTDFNGRPVLVTGAAGGIGGATVRQLVLAGADVIASDRTAESLAQLDARGDVQTLPFELTNEDSIRAAMAGLGCLGRSQLRRVGRRCRPHRPKQTSTSSTR